MHSYHLVRSTHLQPTYPLQVRTSTGYWECHRRLHVASPRAAADNRVRSQGAAVVRNGHSTLTEKLFVVHDSGMLTELLGQISLTHHRQFRHLR